MKLNLTKNESCTCHNFKKQLSNYKKQLIMRLIKFKAVDNYENDFIIFINPEHIESFYTLTNKSRIGIGLVSGNPVEVNHTLKEVIEKLGINVESTDYKRTDKEH
jgi:hypothetical protein